MYYKRVLRRHIQFRSTGSARFTVNKIMYLFSGVQKRHNARTHIHNNTAQSPHINSSNFFKLLTPRHYISSSKNTNPSPFPLAARRSKTPAWTSPGSIGNHAILRPGFMTSHRCNNTGRALSYSSTFRGKKEGKKLNNESTSQSKTIACQLREFLSTIKFETKERRCADVMTASKHDKGWGLVLTVSAQSQVHRRVKTPNDKEVSRIQDIRRRNSFSAQKTFLDIAKS